MLVKATISFVGTISMHKNEVRECEETPALLDILKAGYVVDIGEGKKTDQELAENGGDRNVGKRNNRKKSV